MADRQEGEGGSAGGTFPEAKAWLLLALPELASCCLGLDPEQVRGADSSFRRFPIKLWGETAFLLKRAFRD